MRAAALVLLAVACGSARSRVPAEGDAVVLQRVLDGALAAPDGLGQVARASGWPIPTNQGYLFAVTDAGNGPYRVSSPDNAFPAAPMRTEAGVAWALVAIPQPEGKAYQFVTRSGATFADPLSRRFKYDGASEVSLVAAQGAHLERWPGIGDANLAPRTVRVWVPAQPPTHFLYAHDGQNLFGGYPRGYGGWFLQDGAGPATLIAGIDNSPARFEEYTPVADFIDGRTRGGSGAAYSDFVLHTVRPLVEAKYGTPRRNGVIGSSLGGVIAFTEAIRDPTAWHFAASLSGTMGWGSIGAGVHNQTVIQMFAALASCPAPTLYLDSGGGPGSGCPDADGDGIRDDNTTDATDNYCENAQLLAVLQGLGCGASLHSRWQDGAQHNEAAWRARAPAIVALFETL